MTLNILANNRPMDDPTVGLAWNWRALPRHWRWESLSFWRAADKAAAEGDRKSDARRGEKIAEKEDAI